jgi:hypothetical protein
VISALASQAPFQATLQHEVPSSALKTKDMKLYVDKTYFSWKHVQFNVVNKEML